MAEVNEIFASNEADKIRNVAKGIQEADNALMALSKTLAGVAAQLKESGISFDKVAAAQKTVQQASKETDQVQKQLEQTEKKLVQLEDTRQKTIAKNKREIQERNTQLKAQEVLESKQTGTLQKLVAQNKLLREEQRKLNLETAAGIARNKEINKQLDINTEKIRANSDSYVKQKMNIGNYQSALQGIPGPIAGIIRMLQMLKTALLTNPITAILVAISAAIALVSKSLSMFQPVMDKFNIIVAQGKAVLDVILERIGMFAQAIGKLIKGDFKGAAEAMKEGWSGVGTQIQAATKAAREYQETMNELRDSEGQYNITLAKNRVAMEKYLEAMRNVNLSNKDRIAAADAYIELERENLRLTEERAKQEIISTVSAGNRAAAENLVNEAIRTGTALTREQIGATITNADEANELNNKIAAYIELQANSHKAMQRAITQKNTLTKQLNDEAEAQAKANQVKAKEVEINEQLIDDREILKEMNADEAEMRAKQAEEAEAFINKQLEDARTLADAQMELDDMVLNNKLAMFDLIAQGSSALIGKLIKDDKTAKRIQLAIESALAIAKVIINSSLAQVQALTYLSNPITAPLYPGIIASIKVQKALALGAIAANAVAQFEHGTDYAPHTFIAGEAGRELMQLRSGEVIMANQATLFSGDKFRGAKIHTNAETEAILRQIQKSERSGFDTKAIENKLDKLIAKPVIIQDNKYRTIGYRANNHTKIYLDRLKYGDN